MSIRNGIKIGFTGAGGTGKTTDALALSKELGLNMMKSASRKVYEKLKLSEEALAKDTDEQKLDIQTEIFGMKASNDDNTFEFIADRTLLDHWAYCLMYCGSFMPNNQFTEYETMVRKHMKSTYTHIFYYPWGYWTAEGDGVRQDHWSWQSAIDAIIAGYIVRWNLPVIQVPQSSGIEARQDFVKQAILGKK